MKEKYTWLAYTFLQGFLKKHWSLIGEKTARELEHKAVENKKMRNEKTSRCARWFVER